MSDGLLQAWEKTLRRCGRRRAIVEAANGRSVTFLELDALASAWTTRHGSAARDLAGRAVVFAVPNGIGWFEIFLGLLRAGAVVVPLDPTEPPAAQRRLAETLRAGFWWNGNQLVALPGGRRYRDPGVRLIKLTSGSTGSPRPLVFNSAQLLADARQVTATMRFGDRDLNYGLIPLGHSYGLGNLTIPLLARGVPLVCGAAALPDAIAADFARWRPTVFPGVPVIWRALVASATTGSALASLRLAISAGAPLPPGVAGDFQARFGRRLHNFYGSSETGGIAYDVTGLATLEGGVGGPMKGVKVSLQRDRRLSVSSAAVTTHGNRRRSGRLGSWLMPDRVAMNPRSGLTLLGRRGSTVKIAGRRVNLAELTAKFRQLDGVRDAWVGLSAGTDPVLGAVVVSERTVIELRAALQADTAAWKIPRRILVIPALPVTARGKTNTQALQAMAFGSEGKNPAVG